MAGVRTTQPEAVAIFERLDRLDLNQRDLAKTLNLEENKVSKVKAGERRFTATEVSKAERWLDNIEIRRTPDIPPARDASAGETVEIAQLDLSLSMGPGTEIDDYIEEQPIQFDLGYIRSFTRSQPRHLRIARGVGESMQPTLQSSDQVWIDTSQRSLNQQDRIWAISLYGAAGIKRLRAVGSDRVLVMSDNPLVPDQEVSGEDLMIGGRVIRFSRDI